MRICLAAKSVEMQFQLLQTAMVWGVSLSRYIIGVH